GLVSVLELEEGRVEAAEPLAHAPIIDVTSDRGIRAKCARTSGVSRSAYGWQRARHWARGGDALARLLPRRSRLGGGCRVAHQLGLPRGRQGVQAAQAGDVPVPRLRHARPATADVRGGGEAGQAAGARPLPRRAAAGPLARRLGAGRFGRPRRGARRGDAALRPSVHARRPGRPRRGGCRARPVRGAAGEAVSPAGGGGAAGGLDAGAVAATVSENFGTLLPYSDAL